MASPRVRLVRALTEAIAAAVAAGDLHVARVAHQALGQLLGGETESDEGVVNLDSKRNRR